MPDWKPEVITSIFNSFTSIFEVISKNIYIYIYIYTSFKVLIFLPNFVLQAMQCNQIYNICYRCKQLNNFTAFTLFLVVRIPLPDLIKLVLTTGLFLFSKEAILVEWRVRRIGQHYLTCCI